jgi:hypothetical protein
MIYHGAARTGEWLGDSRNRNPHFPLTDTRPAIAKALSVMKIKHHEDAAIAYHWRNTVAFRKESHRANYSAR